jgi:hypothetical protein
VFLFLFFYLCLTEAGDSSLGPTAHPGPSSQGGDGKIVFPRTRVATMALLAIPIPDEYQPILLTTPSIRTINAVFEKLHKYRRVPFKDMGQFVKEVPKMI